MALAMVHWSTGHPWVVEHQDYVHWSTGHLDYVHWSTGHLDYVHRSTDHLDYVHWSTDHPVVVEHCGEIDWTIGYPWVGNR